ncbi:pirin family protein, partial [Nonlabens antarcticus]
MKHELSIKRYEFGKGSTDTTPISIKFSFRAGRCKPLQLGLKHQAPTIQHTEQEYNLKSQDNGVYIMVVEGAIEINDTTLSYRDAIAI